VVEGYHWTWRRSRQHGIEHAVATLGTATSASHVQKLLRQTDEVVFCFDRRTRRVGRRRGTRSR